MSRDDLVLAALSAAGPGVRFGPAQVQKLFFLLDREIPDEIGGPRFRFAPYDFGPFDAAVYHEIETLAGAGFALVEQGGRFRDYSVTDAGFRRGQQALSAMTPRARDFVARAAQWVKAMSFEQLVSAIYQRYPDMKVRSIFRDA